MGDEVKVNGNDAERETAKQFLGVLVKQANGDVVKLNELIAKRGW
jgi:hypothetical protein